MPPANLCKVCKDLEINRKRLCKPDPKRHKKGRCPPAPAIFIHLVVSIIQRLCRIDAEIQVKEFWIEAVIVITGIPL